MRLFGLFILSKDGTPLSCLRENSQALHFGDNTRHGRAHKGLIERFQQERRHQRDDSRGQRFLLVHHHPPSAENRLF